MIKNNYNCSKTVVIYIKLISYFTLIFCRQFFPGGGNLPNLFRGFEKIILPKGFFAQLRKLSNTPPPIKINNPAILYLPLPCTYVVMKNNIIKSIPGVWQIPPKIRSSVNTDFHTTCLKVIHKFCITFFLEFDIKSLEELTHALENFLKPSIYISENYYYPLCQHVITNLMPFFRFPLDILIQINNNYIDYRYYNDPIGVSAQSILEATVFKQTFLFNTHPRSQIIALHPDNPLSPNEQYKEKCSIVLKQNNGDFIESIKDIVVDVIIKENPRDIKLWYDPIQKINLLRGFLSLTPTLTDGEKTRLLKKYIADLGTLLSQNKTISENEKDALEKYQIHLQKLDKNKELSITEKFNKTQDLMDNDPAINILVCSRIVQMELHSFFDRYYVTYEKEIFAKKTCLDIQKLFPEKQVDSLGNIIQTGQQVNYFVWQNMLKSIIDFMPEGLRIKIIENYRNYKLIENTIVHDISG